MRTVQANPLQVPRSWARLPEENRPGARDDHLPNPLASLDSHKPQKGLAGATLLVQENPRMSARLESSTYSSLRYPN